MVNTNLLKGKIVARGMRQTDVAEAIGISENTLSAKIQGKSSFTLDQVEKLCSILKINDVKEKCEIFLS